MTQEIIKKNLDFIYFVACAVLLANGIIHATPLGGSLMPCTDSWDCPDNYFCGQSRAIEYTTKICILCASVCMYQVEAHMSLGCRFLCPDFNVSKEMEDTDSTVHILCSSIPSHQIPPDPSISFSPESNLSTVLSLEKQPLELEIYILVSLIIIAILMFIGLVLISISLSGRKTVSKGQNTDVRDNQTHKDSDQKPDERRSLLNGENEHNGKRNKETDDNHDEGVYGPGDTVDTLQQNGASDVRSYSLAYNEDVSKEMLLKADRAPDHSSSGLNLSITERSGLNLDAQEIVPEHPRSQPSNNVVNENELNPNTEVDLGASTSAAASRIPVEHHDSIQSRSDTRGTQKNSN